MTCIHTPSMCPGCFYRFVNEEVERWMKYRTRCGDETRDPQLVRANIMRGLRLGTYKTKERVS